ncbi:MAG: glucose-1-phosphate adenylyltransferase [Myxococcales bacterium]|nr:glucose-1-phosphate adenylyltransferase [Myxococcales bacterium]
MHRTLVMVLAGGRGARLMPLTVDRAKPAVPFGGRYRLIDFVLSNLVNSGLFQIVVLTQYMSQSLTRHLSRAWRLSRALDQFVEPVPAQQRTGLDWYKGSADAIFQNLNVIDDESPEHVAVFGADHIYKMNVAHMLDEHVASGAEMTIAAIPVPLSEAHQFGIIEVDALGRMIGFDEKPRHPRAMPGRPDMALASMGNYIFRRKVLVDRIVEDAHREDTTHDFGKDVIPRMLAEGSHIQVYDFSQNPVPGMSLAERGYWRDVGTIDSYYQASMDLIAVSPVMNLYNRDWPIRTDFRNHPPAKFVHADLDRVGMATESLVCEGCIISGGQISKSLLSPMVRVNSFSTVEGCILLDGVNIGRRVVVKNAIIDKGVEVPPGTWIGVDPVADAARGFTVTDSGLVVVPKGTNFR